MPSRPAGERAVADARLAAVIDDHPHGRMALEQPGEIVEMDGKAQRVKGQIEVDDGVERPPDFRPQHPVDIGDVLDQRSNALQPWMGRQPLQLAPSGGIVEIDPADDASDERRRVGHAEQIVRLVRRRRRLDRDRGLNPGHRQERREVRRQIVAAEAGIARRNPAVVAARKPPEMLMAVDDHDDTPDRFITNETYVLGVSQVGTTVPDLLLPGRAGSGHSGRMTPFFRMILP